jgi:hypothetical protein
MILVKTNRPCLRVAHHTHTQRERERLACHRTGGEKPGGGDPQDLGPLARGKWKAGQLCLPHLPYAQLFFCFKARRPRRWGLLSVNAN